MSDSTLARRTEVIVAVDGVDISADINKYLIALTYTDYEEDKTDDLNISLDDRDGIWIQDWLSGGTVTIFTSDSLDENRNRDAKGAEISAVIIQKNWVSDGKDRVLDCGTFEIDSLDISGPPAQASIKATALPYSSTVRTEKKTKAWEMIKLSTLASEIAGANGMKCLFESSFDPLYTRKEQVQISDIVFLQGLCKDAGISLKVTANMIVLFDEQDYEAKPAVRDIERGAADVKTYRFGTSTGDKKYSRCHVSYTDPMSGQTIEYTYTPIGASPDGQTLEINEKVKTRENARQLAMKRLRQKNKAEYQAEFTLVGDVRLVAGVTVNVKGYGMFDGKYIVEAAIFNVSGSGCTVQVKLRRVLEGY